MVRLHNAHEFAQLMCTTNYAVANISAITVLAKVVGRLFRAYNNSAPAIDLNLPLVCLAHKERKTLLCLRRHRENLVDELFGFFTRHGGDHELGFLCFGQQRRIFE